MAITLADFTKIWASTSPLTPYSFGDANYQEGWNFIGSTPPARQMWDSLQKQNDEKLKYIVDNFLPTAGGTMTGAIVGNPLTLTADDGNGNTASLVVNADKTLVFNEKSIPERAYGITLTSIEPIYTTNVVTNSAVIFAKRGNNCGVYMVTYWDSNPTKIFTTGTEPITITKSSNSDSVTITNVNGSAVAIKILNGDTL